ncbi:hypothetical protein [Paenibacillus sp. S150]|uniref:hypothetical protein n=1 Tax=Paenibacillus sp. S150 TaxID=2749826 RepID=UPI001C5658A8|nr:hypothetical protein [Paenibacillus sp. S150]MBW4082938.1 hypothetical protein [Paenibacillus sp. S150]
MENLEIILTNFNKDALDKFILEELNLSEVNIESSHFYDNNSGQDIEFYQIESIIEIFSPMGTGNIVVEKLKFGINLNNIVIVFSFDERLGDIILNFPDSNIFVGDKHITQFHSRCLLKYLINLKNKYNIPNIRFGYEPASDDDTCLISINNDELDINSALEKIIK